MIWHALSLIFSLMASHFYCELIPLTFQTRILLVLLLSMNTYEVDEGILVIHMPKLSEQS